jgi:hypothetical protein
MIAFLSFAGFAFGAGLWMMIREMRRAPHGYQDATGFHTLETDGSIPNFEPAVVPAPEHARAA